MRRKGLGQGKGKGYKNILGKDKQVHSQSAKGIKQPKPINESRLNSMDKVKSKKEEKVLGLTKKQAEKKLNEIGYFNGIF